VRFRKAEVQGEGRYPPIVPKGATISVRIVIARNGDVAIPNRAIEQLPIPDEVPRPNAGPQSQHHGGEHIGPISLIRGLGLPRGIANSINDPLGEILHLPIDSMAAALHVHLDVGPLLLKPSANRLGTRIHLGSIVDVNAPAEVGLREEQDRLPRRLLHHHLKVLPIVFVSILQSQGDRRPIPGMKEVIREKPVGLRLDDGVIDDWTEFKVRKVLPVVFSDQVAVEVHSAGDILPSSAGVHLMIQNGGIGLGQFNPIIDQKGRVRGFQRGDP
jgi:hypothetical protein